MTFLQIEEYTVSKGGKNCTKKKKLFGSLTFILVGVIILLAAVLTYPLPQPVQTANLNGSQEVSPLSIPHITTGNPTLQPENQKTVTGIFDTKQTIKGSKYKSETVPASSASSSPITSLSSGKSLEEGISLFNQTFQPTKYSNNSGKIAYVATSTSGKQVGGLCIWTSEEKFIDFKYFNGSFPEELNSHQDSTDSEMRAILVAVRLWNNEWIDHHVVLRSPHPSVKGSKHSVQVRVSQEVKKLSEGRFTYEFEHRTRRTDSLVNAAYSLARLHKSYEHWSKIFRNIINQLLGKQDWSVIATKNRVKIVNELFTLPS